VADLAGEWELREAIGETWRWYAAAEPPRALNNVAADSATPGWIPARVPGSVVDALAAAAVIPDPRRGFGSRSAEWTASRHWVFRRVVTLGAEWAGADVVLELDGIDPGGRVFWQGAEVARVDGLYRPARVRVPVERAGEHLLVIVVDPVPPGVPQVGRTEDVRRHAPRLGYGWDFCPPFPHQGVWRPARLRRGPRIADLAVEARCDERGNGSVHLRVSAEGAATVRVRLELGGGRAPVEAEVELAPGDAPGDGAATLVLDVPDAPLWHPGAPRLADLTVTVGEHTEVRRVGFRHLAWDGYRLAVNGRPVPLAGINWAPTDAQYGSVTPERLAHLLDLAVAAGVRLIRVWGGGLVETPEFYAACDERGLLVWQEFSQSSSGMQSAPSEDPRFVEALAADARTLVPQRASHPSLVLWGGGNELEGPGGPLATDDSPALQALAAAVAELDPSRGWLPTSPSGPVFHHRLADADPGEQHDVHGPWEYQGLEEQHTLADRGSFLAHTEFGVEGMANDRLWRHIVPEGRGEPADRSNPLHRHLGEWWDNAPQVQRLFGGDLGLDELRRASQWLQCSGLATALEGDRRRWPRTSMVLPWQLAESYPNTWGTALVGFDGEPKPALAVLARAFAPERVTLRTARTAWGGHPDAVAEAWLQSEAGRDAGGTLELALLDPAGTTLASRTVQLDVVGDPHAVAVLRAPAPPGPFLWRATWRHGDVVVDDELLLQTGDADLAGLRSLPRTTLTVGDWIVHNTGPVAAVGWGPRDVRPGADRRLLAALGDPRPILPGESRAVRLVSGVARPGDLVVDAWNADPVALAALAAPPVAQPPRKDPS
jgi:beta-mannosidase